MIEGLRHLPVLMQRMNDTAVVLPQGGFRRDVLRAGRDYVTESPLSILSYGFATN